MLGLRLHWQRQHKLMLALVDMLQALTDKAGRSHLCNTMDEAGMQRYIMASAIAYMCTHCTCDCQRHTLHTSQYTLAAVWLCVTSVV